jgi:predicted amidohydrolase YtcJ
MVFGGMTVKRLAVADLVLRDRAPFRIAPEQISRAGVRATVVGGRLVYRRG